jgi:cation-transporting P-type ATPase D
MLSTTGELLCFCDMRKLQWYVDRGLAERVLQDPPTIRLLFEHKNADQQVRGC